MPDNRPFTDARTKPPPDKVLLAIYSDGLDGIVTFQNGRFTDSDGNWRPRAVEFWREVT